MPDGTPDGTDDDYQSLLQFLSLCPSGLAQFDGSGAISMMNPAFACIAMPLLRPGQMCSNLLDLLQPFVPELRQLLGAPGAAGTLCDGMRVPLGPPSANGEQKVLSLTVVRFASDQFMAVVGDITQQVAHERRLKETEAYFAAIAHGVEDYALFSVDGDGLISDWNVSAQRMFAYDAATVTGTHAGGIVTTGAADPAAFRLRLREAARTGWHLDEGWRRRGDGSRFWGTCMLSPFEAGGADGEPPINRFLMVVRDNTERRNSAEELRRALTTDHLTGLLNRRTFFERATAALERQQLRGAPSCVAMVDADHFKAVNDTYGHPAGDAALRALAAALATATREDDLVGRLGGEEFAVLLPGTAPDAAAEIAERLRASVAALPIEHAGRRFFLTVSIGMAGATSVDLQSLLARADEALYAAKHGGRNRLCLADTGAC